jgi:hypothetical protein
MINLKKVKSLIEEKIQDPLELEVKYEFVDEYKFLQASASITFKSFDDTVLFQILVWENGAASVQFIFDKLEENEETLKLVNKANNSIRLFKSWIRDDGYFIMEHAILTNKNETEFLDNVNFLIDTLLNEESVAVLKPITELTT